MEHQHSVPEAIAAKERLWFFFSCLMWPSKSHITQINHSWHLLAFMEDLVLFCFTNLNKCVAFIEYAILNHYILHINDGRLPAYLWPLRFQMNPARTFCPAVYLVCTFDLSVKHPSVHFFVRWLIGLESMTAGPSLCMGTAFQRLARVRAVIKKASATANMGGRACIAGREDMPKNEGGQTPLILSAVCG